MTEPRKAIFSFTKLFVQDLEKLAAYYQEVFGLNSLQRFQAQIAGDPIDEIMMGPGQQLSAESLVLIKYMQRPCPSPGEAIVGFTTSDVAAVVARARKAGGMVVQDVTELKEFGIKFAFVKDPEGHLAEVVQMLG